MYPTLMTSTRAKMLIAGVWVMSFIICFPPLVGWNDRHQNLAMSNATCHLTCELTNEIGYVMYSALGSFFLPMFVMMFFYWKIYLAAAETTKAINRGFKTMHDQKDGASRRFDNERLTLRIHRGKNNSDRGGGAAGGACGSHQQYSHVRKTRSSNLQARNLYDAPSTVPHEDVELISVDNNRKTKSRLLKKSGSMTQLETPRYK